MARNVFAKPRSPAAILFEDVRAKRKFQAENTTPEKAEDETTHQNYVDAAKNEPKRKEETASSTKEGDKKNVRSSDDEGENKTPVEKNQPNSTTQGGELKSTEGKEKSLRDFFNDLGSNDASVVEHASNELIEMKLWSDDGQKKKTLQFIQKGATSPSGLTLKIIKALRNHQSNPVITCNCLNLLLGLTSLEIKEFNKSISELEGCKYVIQSMKNFPKHVQIQSHGIGLICNICTWSKKDAAKIVDWEGIDVVTASMKEYPEIPDIQRRGSKCLAELESKSRGWFGRK